MNALRDQLLTDTARSQDQDVTFCLRTGRNLIAQHAHGQALTDHSVLIGMTETTKPRHRIGTAQLVNACAVLRTRAAAVVADEWYSRNELCMP